jgi:hypothetical protein
MMYIAHLAWAVDLIVVAAGFVALHFATKQKSSHLKTAAWILTVGGAISLGCSLYYSFTYWQQGAFETPTLMHNMNVMPMHNGPMQPSN